MSGKIINHDVKLSKSLSWLLRHGAQTQGIKLDESGFAKIDDILHLNQFKNIKVEDIIKIVENNDKKRFSIRQEENTNLLMIRANQGHSIPVLDDNLLTSLSIHEIPPILYHGTYKKHVEDISQYGLCRMNRNHVHFTHELPGKENTVSGIRKNCDYCVVIDPKKALQHGLKFYKSENEVFLTPGDCDGFVRPFCFKGIWPIADVEKYVLL